jgi:serine phosphatase RsbU (regulator of sigma subunit)
MSEARRRTADLIWLRRYVWALVLFWTAAVGVTLAWELFNQRNAARDVARAEARGACKRNEGFLRWYSSLGGLYAPVSRNTQPNRALAYLRDRDVAMPSGRLLTLVDPIDMMQQVRELSEEESDLHANLTEFERSPSAHDNAPDPWETGALDALERGKIEASSVSAIKQASYMRVMRPMTLDRSCVKCHPGQANHVGQVYGGFSVSLPMDTVWPNERTEMIRRVFGYGSMWLLGLGGIAFGSRNLRRQIQRRRQAEQALRQREAQMLAAQQIQERLLPAGPPQLPGFDIAGASHPAEFTGGDYFDYIPMRNGDVAVAVADVCGHGLGPALLMASTQAFLRSSAEVCDDVGELLGRVNRCLSDVAEQHRFVTCFLGRLDPQNRSFAYSNAGHPTGYVLDSSGAVKRQLESTALPLGVEPHTSFPLGGVVPLEAGDTILLLTDGILEAQSARGEAFGIERALHSVREAPAAKAAEIINRLFLAVNSFCGPTKPVDDVTAVVIRVDATP